MDQQHDNRDHPVATEEGPSDETVGARGGHDPRRNFVREPERFGLRRPNQELPPDWLREHASAKGQSGCAHDHARRDHTSGNQVDEQHFLALEPDKGTFGDLDEQNHRDPLSCSPRHHAHHEAQINGPRNHDEPDEQGRQHSTAVETVLEGLKQIRFELDIRALPGLAARNLLLATLLAHPARSPFPQMPPGPLRRTLPSPPAKWSATAGTAF